eukprot:scaffold8727_cov47-Attheya_sp.AAC.3
MADHKLLFAILKKYGIPDTLITVIEKMYTDAILVFKTGTETREVPYKEVGVKQGDNMAPVLYDSRNQVARSSWVVNFLCNNPAR